MPPHGEDGRGWAPWTQVRRGRLSIQGRAESAWFRFEGKRAVTDRAKATANLFRGQGVKIRVMAQLAHACDLKIGRSPAAPGPPG